MPRDDVRLDLLPDARAELPEHLTSLDLNIVAAWEAERQPGEVFLWMGRPNRIRAVARSTGSAALAVGCTLAALTILASHFAARPVPPIGPGFVFLVGFFVIAGGIGCRATASATRQAGQTVYALSDRRALIREPRGAAGFVVRSYGPDRLASLAATSHQLVVLGSDIVLEWFVATHRLGFWFDHRRGFWDIDDAPKVSELLRAHLLPLAAGSRRAESIPARDVAYLSPFALAEGAPPAAPTLDHDFAPRDPTVDALVERELDADEKLVWVGRPRPAPLGRVIHPRTWNAVLQVAVGILVAFSAWGWWTPVALLLWLTGSVLANLGLARSFRAWDETSRAGGPIYLLTNRRAVVGQPDESGGMRVESFTASHLGGLVRREGPDGSGDLIFEEFGPAIGGRPRPARLRGFLNVEGVHDVERLVRSTLLADPRSA